MNGSGAEDRLELANGTKLRVRPIGPGDKDGLRRAFERLSPESRYRRFFSPITELSERDLAYLTEIDHEDHEAIVAVEPGGEIVGVARYVRTDDPAGDGEGEAGSFAEASIVVADDWHHRGVATGLLERLARRARAAGITHFLAIVLSENRDAIELFEHFGPQSPERRTESGYLELVIELPESGELSDSLLARALRDAARGAVTMNPWTVLVEAIRRLKARRP